MYLRVTASFLKCLVDSVNRCPVHLREVLCVILNETKVKFGDKAIKTLARIYFRDFICPIITNLLEYNLVDSAVTGNYWLHYFYLTDWYFLGFDEEALRSDKSREMMKKISVYIESIVTSKRHSMLPVILNFITIVTVSH